MKPSDIPVGAKVRWVDGIGNEINGIVELQSRFNGDAFRKIVRSSTGIIHALIRIRGNEHFELIEPISINKDEFKKRLKEELGNIWAHVRDTAQSCGSPKELENEESEFVDKVTDRLLKSS